MNQTLKPKFDLEDRTIVFSERIILLCKKESKEAQYWLRLLAKSVNDENIISEIRILWQESLELGKIFSAIALKSK